MDTYSSAFDSSRPAVAIVGAGAMGRALGLRLVESGYPVEMVISRSLSSAEALAAKLGARASDRLGDLPAVPLVLLTVPDDQIADLAETLVDAPRPWRGAVVLHTSGAQTASALEPLRAEGARTLSFHPLQAVTRDADADTLAGVAVGIEGEEPGRAAGIELAVGLGMRYLIVAADAKPRYHLAAAMASNLLVTLMGMVQEVLASIDVDRRQAMAILGPLVQGTLDNLSSGSVEEALTGPVARGDLGTLRMHGLALRKHLPHLVPAYAALSVETVRLAVRAGTLSPSRAEDVLTLMERMVTMPLPQATPTPDTPRPPAPSRATA
ncbi:Rossmann-like and DUF2520 domain-containing protein [Rubrivirga sp. IMCC45206]|uniref:Rossmann-like and DUF2520 domain-containing protein n=1 Tax=Rubrivirga sp. IMCC45206 TaxID=3391614 RepID=UPI0039902EC8